MFRLGVPSSPQDTCQNYTTWWINLWWEKHCWNNIKLHFNCFPKYKINSANFHAKPSASLPISLRNIQYPELYNAVQLNIKNHSYLRAQLHGITQISNILNLSRQNLQKKPSVTHAYYTKALLFFLTFCTSIFCHSAPHITTYTPCQRADYLIFHTDMYDC